MLQAYLDRNYAIFTIRDIQSSKIWLEGTLQLYKTLNFFLAKACPRNSIVCLMQLPCSYMS